MKFIKVTQMTQARSYGALQILIFQGRYAPSEGNVWWLRRTRGASDIVTVESSGEDPRATRGLVSYLPRPRVNKTKQHTLGMCLLLVPLPLPRAVGLPWPPCAGLCTS